MAADDQTINAFKMPRATLARLDAWLEALNQGRRGPRLSRTDLMRGVLDWASEHRPDWEARSAPAPELAPVTVVPVRESDAPLSDLAPKQQPERIVEREDLPHAPEGRARRR